VNFVKDDTRDDRSLGAFFPDVPDCLFGIVAFLPSLRFSFLSKFLLLPVFGRDSGDSSHDHGGTAGPRDRTSVGRGQEPPLHAAGRLLATIAARTDDTPPPLQSTIL